MKLIETQEQRYKLFINLFVLGLSLFGIARKEYNYNESSAFERFMIDSLAPMQRSMGLIKFEISNFFEFYLNNINASKDNQALKKSISELNNQIFSYHELDKENKRLKELLDFGEEIPSRKVLAQIVAWDASSDFKILRVNKGHSDGIKLQSPVVTSVGLVGYIYRLTDHFADILTVLDPNNRIDGLVGRTRSHGIIEGLSTDRAIMKYVARTEPVVLDDLVVTSGLGNIYPKGVQIGTISKIERESYGITQYIEITPAVDFSKLEEVVVLVSDAKLWKQKEWDALDNDKENEEGLSAQEVIEENKLAEAKKELKAKKKKADAKQAKEAKEAKDAKEAKEKTESEKEIKKEEAPKI